MSPHSECGDFTSPTTLQLQCIVLSWKEICRLLPSPERRDPKCTTNNSSAQQESFSFEFKASQIFLHSIPLFSNPGVADIYVDGIWSGQLKLVSRNSSWFKYDLDSNIIHTLTILPTVSLPIDLFVLILSNRTNSSHFLPNANLDLELTFHSDIASEKDGSSGAIISIASLAAVIMVVLICSVCFFLNRSRRRPGFHMPSVLVNVTTSGESNTDIDSNNYRENNRKRSEYEEYELSSMFSTGTTATKSTWKEFDDRHFNLELQYEYHSRPQPKPPSETHSLKMGFPPNDVYASSSSQTQVSGSETPKRRLSWHEDQIQA